MKKLTLLVGALVIAGSVFACDGDKKGGKSCCKKGEKKEACCKKDEKKACCKKDEKSAKKEDKKETAATDKKS